MSAYKAFVFDLNGTMIDDMACHGEVWYGLLNELGAELSYEQVKPQLYGKNEELLERIFGKGHFTAGQLQQISAEKEKRYQELFRQRLALIPGLAAFLEKAASAGVLMGIGSAAVMYNIDFVLDNLQVRHYFKALISADEVVHSKPDPETFLKCAALLGVPPEQCVVFEDAPKGVEAARNAGMKAVVITTAHPPEDFTRYDNALFFISDYTDDRLNGLFA